MNSVKMKKPLAFLLAVLMAITGLGQAAGVMAAGTEGVPDAWGDLVLYDETERTDLDADEIAVAEDINVLKDSDYDVTDVRDGISFHEDKVAVSYYAGKSDFLT